jgi:hypothetical protein
MSIYNNLEGPAKFFAENKAAHVTAVFGAAFPGVLFGVCGARAEGRLVCPVCPANCSGSWSDSAAPG